MFILYVLEDCPFCNNALQVLKENKIKHKAIIIENTAEQKAFYKKQSKMDTFPQIFLKTSNNELLKIGGNDDLIEALRICDLIKSSSLSIDTIYNVYKHVYKGK